MPDAKCPAAIVEALERYAAAIRTHQAAVGVRAIGGPGPNGGHTAAVRRARDAEAEARVLLERVIAGAVEGTNPRPALDVATGGPVSPPGPREARATAG